MPKTILVIAIVLTAILATVAGTIAQESTPVIESSPADDCDVTARSEEELTSLNATATAQQATPVAMPAIELPEGEPLDAATLNALDETLRLVEACAESGDIGKLLALYSDAYVTGIALAPEPEPIVPGQGHAHAEGGAETPAKHEIATPSVTDAVRLEDGRIAAKVISDGAEGAGDIVFFVEQNGAWVIDDIREALPEGPIGGDLPFPVQAAIAAAAIERGVAIEAVSVVRFEAVDWPDSSLGCPKEGEFYAQVITPGYLVVLSIDGEEIEYHTDSVDRAVPCEPA
jgi:hypothetical protein